MGGWSFWDGGEWGNLLEEGLFRRKGFCGLGMRSGLGGVCGFLDDMI